MKYAILILMALSLSQVEAANCTLKVKVDFFGKDTVLSPRNERILTEKGYALREDGEFTLRVIANHEQLCGMASFRDEIKAGYYVDVFLIKTGARRRDHFWEGSKRPGLPIFNKTRAKTTMRRLLRELPDCETLSAR